MQVTREFHDIHREEVRGDALYKRYEDEEAKQSRKRREGDILYDAQKMIPSSSESDDDSPEEEEKVNDSLFQQSQAQFQSVDATSDDSDIQSQSLLK